MPEQKAQPGATEKTAEKAPTRYMVLSRGISTPAVIGGAVYHGQVVTSEQLGDAARIAKLLARKAIEETTDAADG